MTGTDSITREAERGMDILNLREPSIVPDASSASGNHSGSGVNVSKYLDPSPHPETNITGRFGQYQSGFWQLAMPMLSARYIGRWVSNWLHLDVFTGRGKLDPLIQRSYGIFVGVVMLGVTSLYAGRTWGDMKREFSESLGWEFNKKPEEVGILDFARSKNAIVQTTFKNYKKYNFRRLLMTVLPFFNFLLPSVLAKPGDTSKGMNIYNSVDLGAGTTGLYLATDVVGFFPFSKGPRKQTFFERLQSFMDEKINQTAKVGELIAAGDLINLYEIHARDNGGKANDLSLIKMNTPEWESDQALFGRMAELMNQTYGNKPNTAQANFTVPKFIYLLGSGLVKSRDTKQNLAYVEIANRYGIEAVKQVAKALQAGGRLEDILQQFPAIQPLIWQESAGASASDVKKDIFNQPVTEDFASHLNPRPAKPVVPSAVSHTEKAAQRSAEMAAAQGLS